MQRPYLLVGDIGGTRCLFELFENRDGSLWPVHEQSYRSGVFPWPAPSLAARSQVTSQRAVPRA